MFTSHQLLSCPSLAFSAGETAEFVNIFPVTFNPDGVVCNQLTKLCMNFEKGTGPVPAFGLEFLAPSEVCVDVICRGKIQVIL